MKAILDDGSGRALLGNLNPGDLFVFEKDPLNLCLRVASVADEGAYVPGAYLYFEGNRVYQAPCDAKCLGVTITETFQPSTGEPGVDALKRGVDLVSGTVLTTPGADIFAQRPWNGEVVAFSGDTKALVHLGTGKMRRFYSMDASERFDAYHGVYVKYDVMNGDQP